MKSKTTHTKSSASKASKPAKPAARDLTVKQAGGVKGGAIGIKLRRT